MFIYSYIVVYCSTLWYIVVYWGIMWYIVVYCGVLCYIVVYCGIFSKHNFLAHTDFRYFIVVNTGRWPNKYTSSVFILYAGIRFDNLENRSNIKTKFNHSVLKDKIFSDGSKYMIYFIWFFNVKFVTISGLTVDSVGKENLEGLRCVSGY